MKQIIKDEITEQEQRAKYGNIGGDYWTDLSEPEINFLMGKTWGFSKNESGV